MSTHVEWYQAWHWKHCFLSSGSLQTQLISTDSFVRHMWYGTPWCFWEWNHSPRFQTADVVLMHSTLVISLICWIQSMTQINGICQWRQTTITAPHLLLYLFIGQSDCTPWIYNVMPAYCVWTWFVKHAVKDIDCFRIDIVFMQTQCDPLFKICTKVDFARTTSGPVTEGSLTPSILGKSLLSRIWPAPICCACSYNVETLFPQFVIYTCTTRPEQ